VQGRRLGPGECRFAKIASSFIGLRPWVQLAAACGRAPASRYNAAARCLAARASSSADGATLGAAFAASDASGLAEGPSGIAGSTEARPRPTPEASTKTQRSSAREWNRNGERMNGVMRCSILRATG
jgi:hypothetical protein